nr:bacteriophage spanin2 family protein [Ruegeria sp. Ofav3-42]
MSAALSSCTAGQALNLLTGGGPNVAANVQAGANNVQGVQSDRRQAVKNVTGDVRQERTERQVRAERIETVVTHEYPAWLILAFAVAVLVDSPLRWPGQIAKAFRRPITRKT